MGIVQSLTAIVASLLVSATALAQPYLSEMFINPPGSDQGFESIEFMGEPGLALTDHWFIVIAGDKSDAGKIAHLVDLSAHQLGSEGILLVRDDPTIPILPAISSTTVVATFDFTPDLTNGTSTYVLATGTPWFTQGTDLDFDNNGTIDFALAMKVVDAVSYSDGGSTDREYAAQLGGSQLGTLVGPNGSYTPDALYRLHSVTGEIMSWAGGELSGPVAGPWTWSGGDTFGFENACVSNPIQHPLDLGNENWKFSPYADCDQSTGVGVLDIFDFLCFIDAFMAGKPYACDCDYSTGPEGCDIMDFICFQRAYVTGCR